MQNIKKLEDITDYKLLTIYGHRCAIAKFNQCSKPYYVGYIIFPEEYKDTINKFDNEILSNKFVTYFNSYGVPPLLELETYDGKLLNTDQYCYLGADTNHAFGENTEQEIMRQLFDIIQTVEMNYP